MLKCQLSPPKQTHKPWAVRSLSASPWAPAAPVAGTSSSRSPPPPSGWPGPAALCPPAGPPAAGAAPGPAAEPLTSAGGCTSCYHSVSTTITREEKTRVMLTLRSWTSSQANVKFASRIYHVWDSSPGFPLSQLKPLTFFNAENFECTEANVNPRCFWAGQ